MGTQGMGRKRSTKKERSTAEDDALNLIAREAEARLAAKRAARAEAREIRMKELERQQKEIFQVQKKYYGLNTKVDDHADRKWGDIEQWMEDSERYSRSSRIQTLSDEDERMSVGSRGSVRSDLDTVGAYGGGGSSLHKKSKKKKKHKQKDRDRNGYDDDYSVMSSRSSRLSDESRVSRSSRLDLTNSRLSDDSRLSRVSRLDLQPTSYASSDLYSLNGLSSSRNPSTAFNGYQFYRSLSQITQQIYRRSSLYEDSVCSGSRRVSSSHPLDYSSYRSSGSRASSRASSARASPVDNSGSVASFLRSAASSSGLPRELDDVTIPDFSDVEDRDYLEKGSRAASVLTAGTLTSLGGSSSRRGSGETALTVDAESSLREIKEIHELKDQIQDVESKYSQNLKEVKDALAQSEEKYRKAMVSNAQLDNEKNNLMYQVDTLKDSLMELEELLSESRREFEEKVKEYEREKHSHGVLQFQFNEMKETLKQSEELLNDIRQLRIKQEGYIREISDLQETVEWKDKKIGALERQKEYTDAIRIERDELREEVVTLKDILKKHGIVLGPDLNINGDVNEAVCDGSPAADSADLPGQEPLTNPTEGNSMLGNTEETELRSSRKEDVDPQQQQEIHEESKENLLMCDARCDEADVSTLEASDEKHLPDTHSSVEEDDNCKDLIFEPGMESKAAIASHSGPRDDFISLPETEVSEQSLNKLRCPEREETEIKSNAEIHDSDFTETSNSLSETRDKKCEDTEGADLLSTESCHQQTAASVTTENPVDGSVTALCNTESHLEPNHTDEAEKDAAEKNPNNSNKNKKRKKKKKGKKKGATHDQQSSGTEKENSKTVRQEESAEMKNECLAEPSMKTLVTEDIKQSSEVLVNNEQDAQQDKDQVEDLRSDSEEKSLKTTRTECNEAQKGEESKILEVEAAQTPENLIDTSLPNLIYEQAINIQETSIVESVEAVDVTDSCHHAETHKELWSDSRKNDEDDDLRWKTDELEAETKVDLRSEDSLKKEGAVCEHNTDTAHPDSTNTNFIHADSKSVEQMSEFVEVTTECATSSGLGMTHEENIQLESLVSTRGYVSAIESESMKISLPSTTDAFRKSSQSEPSAASKSHIDSSFNVLVQSPQDENKIATNAEEEPPAFQHQDSERQETGMNDLDDVVTETRVSDEHHSASFDRESECSPVTKQSPCVDAETMVQNELQESEGQRRENEEQQKESYELMEWDERQKESEAEAAQLVDQMDESVSELKRKGDPSLESCEDASRTKVGSSVQQENIDGEDLDHGDSQHDGSPKPHESLAADSENIQLSPSTRLESDEEDEGQSFDFDELDMEAAVAVDLPDSPQEEFEEGVEALSGEDSNGKSRSCQGHTQPDGNTQDKQTQPTCPMDQQLGSEGMEPEPQGKSDHKENALEEEEPEAAEEERSELGAVVENIKHKMSSLVEEAFDVVKLDWQSEGPASPKSPDKAADHKDLPQAGRGLKKGGKKGKSKEDCKVS